MARLCNHPLCVFRSGEAALTKLLLQSATEQLLQLRQAEMRGSQRVSDTCLLRTFSLVLSVRHHTLLLAVFRVVVSQGCSVMGEGSCAVSDCALSTCVQKMLQAMYKQQPRKANHIQRHTCVECIDGESSKNLTSVFRARVVLPKATVSLLASLQRSLESRDQGICPVSLPISSKLTKTHWNQRRSCAQETSEPYLGMNWLIDVCQLATWVSRCQTSSSAPPLPNF